jgi:hypothetical protein
MSASETTSGAPRLAPTTSILTRSPLAKPTSGNADVVNRAITAKTRFIAISSVGFFDFTQHGEYTLERVFEL